MLSHKENDPNDLLIGHFLTNQRRSILPISGLIESCESKYNISKYHLLQNTGIIENDLDDPLKRVNLKQVMAVRINAVRFLDPTELGQTWGEAYCPDKLWLFGLYIKTAPTLEASIHACLALQPYLEYLPFKFEFSCDQGIASINIPFKLHTSRQGLITSENAMMSRWMNLLEYLGLPENERLSLSFTLNQENSLDKYSYYASHQLQFGQQEFKIEVSESALKTPSNYADAQLHDSTKKYLSSSLPFNSNTNDEPDFLKHIHTYITDRFINHHDQIKDICVEKISNELGVSPSTLNRHLKKLGIGTFKKFIYDGKLELAEKHLLTTNHSVEEIARMLGYRNDANFVRAFKKRKGIAPNKFRTAALSKS